MAYYEPYTWPNNSLQRTQTHLLIRVAMASILAAVATVLFIRFYPAFVAWLERVLTNIRISILLAAVFAPLTGWLLFSVSLWAVPSYLAGPIAIALLASGFLSLLGLTGCLLIMIKRFKTPSQSGRNGSKFESQP